MPIFNGIRTSYTGGAVRHRIAKRNRKKTRKARPKKSY